MDGVPFVTQCPILPGQTFTYRFLAEPPGTHLYHSHFHNQRLDGLFGLLVVHSFVPILPQLYATIADWWRYDALDSNILNPLSKEVPGAGDIMTNPAVTDYSRDNNLMSLLKFHSILINGKGRFEEESRIPLSEFYLIQSQQYRVRMAHAGSSNILDISLDGHELIILASDGYNLNPITVDSFHLHPGETVDFEIRANQAPMRYWLRAETLRYGVGANPVPDNVVNEGRAIVTYEGETDPDEPQSTKKNCAINDPCVIFNCVHLFARNSGRKCVGIHRARSTYTQAFLNSEFGLQDNDVTEYFLNYALPDGRTAINNRIDLGSRAPFYTDNHEDYVTPCDDTLCDQAPCRCSHVLDLPFNRTIQMVLFSYNPGYPLVQHHNAHIHGYSFAVLAMGLSPIDETTGFWNAYNPGIVCDDGTTYCTRPRWNNTARPTLNLNNPPIKDTVVIPSRGYVVVRFRTTNPGPFLFHCHHEFHALDGMVMTLNVAPERRPDVPPGFSSCMDFDWSEQEFDVYLDKGKAKAKHP